MKTRVAITGMGVISSLGNSPADVHSALCNGQTGTYLLPESAHDAGDGCRGGGIAGFQAASYLKGKHLRPLDRTGQMVAAAAKLALESSGWTVEQLGTQNVGLVLGTMFGSIHTISQFDRQGLVQGPASASPMDFANTVINAAAGQTAIWHNLRGINSTIAGGSTSGLMALGYAADLIRFSGQAAVLAGGCDEFCLESFCGFDRAGMLVRPSGQKMLPVPFAAGRSGFAVAEAAALLMLEEWESAVARGAGILGEIRGHGSAFAPDDGPPEHRTAAIGRAMQTALVDAGLSAANVDCISASANGSLAADRHEALAIHSVFNGHPRRREIPVTAIKSMIGETLGAGGAMQAIDLAESVRTRTLPPIHGLEQSDPDLPALNFCRTRQDIHVRSGLITSVGIDGNVCALLMSEPSAPNAV
jgi:3-oxoacyl-[acyl-carrier-protein] synthase II